MLILAFFLLVGVMTSSVTYAWLSMNQKVDEDTYGLSVKVTPNLVISQSSTSILTLKGDSEANAVNIANFADKFTPATHYAEDTVYLLGCLTSYDDVDRNTGLSSTATVTNLPENDNGLTADGKRYFQDYTVYIAATDIAITSTHLTISLDASAENSHSDKDTLSYQAASVDFYLDSVSSDNFKGTLNIAGMDAAANDGATIKTSLDIYLPENTIPKNTDTDGYITLIMRCYFDGALCFKDGSGDNAKIRCYVNMDTVSTKDVKFTITITETDNAKT